MLPGHADGEQTADRGGDGEVDSVATAGAGFEELVVDDGFESELADLENMCSRMSTLEAMLSRVKPGNLFAAGILSQQKGSSYLETPRDDAPANFHEIQDAHGPAIRSSSELPSDDGDCDFVGVIPAEKREKTSTYTRGKALWSLVRESNERGELRPRVVLLQILDKVRHRAEREKAQDAAAARAMKEMTGLRVKAAKFGDLSLMRPPTPRPALPSDRAARSWEWWEEPVTLDQTSPKSLFFFGRDSAVRRACWAVYKSNTARAFFILMLITNNVFVSLVPDNINGSTLNGGDAAAQPTEPTSALEDTLVWAGTFDLVCMTVLCLEILIGSAACGLASLKHMSWLSASAVNPVDLIVLIFAIVEYGLLAFGYKPLMMRSLRLLRLFRLFDPVPVLWHINAMVITLQKGAGQFVSVWFVFLSFVVSFGIFGMELYPESFSRSCRVQGSEVIMGGYPFRTACSFYSETDNALGFTGEDSCPMQVVGSASQSSKCVKGPNLGDGSFSPFGFTHFDHFGGAFLSMVQLSRADSVQDLLFTVLYAEPVVAPLSYIFFWMVNLCCAFLCPGLFTAVVTGTFQRVRCSIAMKAALERHHKDLGNGPAPLLVGSAGISSGIGTAGGHIESGERVGSGDDDEGGALREDEDTDESGKNNISGMERVDVGGGASKEGGNAGSVKQNGVNVGEGGVNGDRVDVEGVHETGMTQQGGQLREGDDEMWVDGEREGTVHHQVSGQGFGAEADDRERARGGLHTGGSDFEKEGGEGLMGDVDWNRVNSEGANTGLERQGGAGEGQGGGDGRDEEDKAVDELIAELELDSGNAHGGDGGIGGDAAADDDVDDGDDDGDDDDDDDGKDGGVTDHDGGHSVGGETGLGTTKGKEGGPGESGSEAQNVVRTASQDDSASPVGFRGWAARNGTYLSSAVILGHLTSLALNEVEPWPGVSAAAWPLHIAFNAAGLADLAVRILFEPRGFAKSPGKWPMAAITICGVAGVVYRLVLGDAKWAELTATDPAPLLLLYLPALKAYALMRHTPTLSDLLQSTVAASGSLGALCVFVLLCAVVFGVAARYVIEDDMDDIGRSNFGTVQASVFTMIRITAGDGWTSVLYSAAESQDTAWAKAIAASIILAWSLFSYFILNNLFVAVIIEHFHISEVDVELGHLSRLRSTVAAGWRKLTGGGKNKKRVAPMPDGAVVFDDSPRKKAAAKQRNTEQTAAAAAKAMKNAIDDVAVAIEIARENDADGRAFEPTSLAGRERVLYCMWPEHPLRRFCARIYAHDLFTSLVMACIIMSCIMLAFVPPYLDMPGQPGPLIPGTVVRWLSLSINILFTVEMFVGVLANGLVDTGGAYFASLWGWLDLIVLIFAWIDELSVFEGGQVAMCARLFRAVRPLRLIKRNAGMRMIIDALGQTMMPVVHVGIYAAITLLSFAVLCQGVMGGRLKRCTPSMPYPLGKTECSGISLDGNDWASPRSWANPQSHFDTFSASLKSVFTIAFLKYVGVLENMADSAALGKNPEQDRTLWIGVVVVCIIVALSFFALNIFLGFIVDGFNAKADSETAILYTRFLRQLRTHRPRRTIPYPKNRPSAAARSFVATRGFHIWSSVCTTVNVLMMATRHADTTDEFEAFIYYQNLTFGILLSAEVALQLVAYGPAGSIADGWLLLDLAVAMSTWGGYIGGDPSAGQFAKGFRLLRLMRLLRILPPVRVILETLVISLPQLFNIVLLLFLVYSIFAVITTQLYAATAYGNRTGPTAGFGNFWQSLLTIVMIVQAGDEWHVIMDDVSLTPPRCTPAFTAAQVYGWQGPDLSFGDCGSEHSPILFPVMLITCSCVMLNLFVGMILNNFSFMTDEVAHISTPDWSSGPSGEQVERIGRVFKTFDIGSGHMPVSSLSNFLNALPQPLGNLGPDGVVASRPRDKASERLIRAELYLIAKEDSIARSLSTILSRISSKLLPGTREERDTIVGYEEVAMTLLYWRKPEMIPSANKVARHERIDEVVKAMHELTLKDFLINCVARRKQREMQDELEARRQEKSASRMMEQQFEDALLSTVLRQSVVHSNDSLARGELASFGSDNAPSFLSRLVRTASATFSRTFSASFVSIRSKSGV